MADSDGDGPTSSGGGVLTMRSIYVGTAPSADAESQAGARSSLRHRSGNPREASNGDIARKFDDKDGAGGREQNSDDGDGEDGRDASDPVLLPPSTHSLLFTQPVLSLPFLFATAVMALSFACLLLALLNGLMSRSVPVAVTAAVMAVQYLTVLVVLLMEEEIPTGLWLLRMIPREALHERFPRMKYPKFVFSSILRILNGYCFLINVTLVIIHSTGVLEIFYDVLALQFVQQLDDIGFALARKDVLGKAMQRACTAKCFRAEFRKRRTRGTRRASILLKAVYFVNLGLILGTLGVVSFRQRTMRYQHASITVDLGDAMWERASVTIPHWLPPHVELYVPPPDTEDEWMLLYAFFNGVYQMEGEPHNGRPVYKERRKFADNYSKFAIITPAEIKYCSGIKSWVFTHANIKKSKSAEKRENEQGCNWLLRSPPTEEYDLLKVEGDWRAWVGVIGKTEVSITTDGCSDATDCSLNGDCIDGKCVCESGDEDGVQYFGSHCEVAFRDQCRTIMGDDYNERYAAAYLRDLRKDYTGDAIMQAYNRPMYSYVEGDPELDEVLAEVKNEVKEEFGFLADFTVFYEYTGNRWFGRLDQTLSEKSRDAAGEGEFIADYHAFWESKTEQLIAVSDPTTKSTPVGVDFYYTGRVTGEMGERFGPFGLLDPFNDQTGRGYFQCSDSDSN